MKKLIKITLVFMLVLLTILCTKVFATDVTEESEDLAITGLEITAPEAGVYGEGQEVTITFTFNKGIKGVMPKYKIYFGSNSSNTIELETAEITEFTNTVSYKYTIKSGDNGELKPSGFVDAAQYTITDEDGRSWRLSSPFILKFENKILADTTIEWADFTEATFELETATSGQNKDFDISIGNCTLTAANSYYVHFSHEEEETIVVKNQDEITTNKEFWQSQINSTYNKIYLSADELDLFAEVGDIYMTVCEIDNSTDVPKIVLQSEKIEKLPSLPITQRLTAYFFDDETSTFCWENYASAQEDISYKIGKVTDLELLNSLKEGNASSLSDLMAYAKGAEAIATGTVKLGEDETITDDLDIIDDEYYYVYLELDTVDGKYTKIEDVNLYQALIGETVGKNLFSMDDDQFEWNLKEEPTPEPEPEPEDSTIAEKPYNNAGENGMLILMVVTVVVVAVVIYRKNKKYEDII